MAFFAGMIGSVLQVNILGRSLLTLTITSLKCFLNFHQAAISLAGALIGPLFGSYLLGIICPFANAHGVTTGLVLGESFGLWLLAGSIVYPAPKRQLLTSVSQCMVNSTLSSLTSPMASPIRTIESEGALLRMYHIAFLLVPVSGFFISFFVGILASIAFGGLKEVDDVNPQHLNPIAWHIWPKSVTPSNKRDDRVSTAKNLYVVFCN